MGVISGPRISSRGSEFELVENNWSDGTTTGWVKHSGSSTASVVSVGGVYRFRITSTANNVTYWKEQIDNLVVGHTYVISLNSHTGSPATPNEYFYAGSSSVGTQYVDESNLNDKHMEFTFTATSASLYITIGHNCTSGSNMVSEWSGISVKPVTSPLVLCLDAGLNRSTSAMADAGHPTKAGLTYGGPGVEEDYQPTGCKLITRADKTIAQGTDLRKYDINTEANWAGPATGAGALFTMASGGNSNGFFGYLNTGYGFTSNPVVGRRYRLLMRAKSTSSIHLRFYDGVSAYTYFSADVGTTLKTYTFDFTCLHATNAFVYGTSSFSAGETVYFDRYEVYELTPWLDVSGGGHHATPELGINGLTIESGTDKRGQGLKYFDLDGTDDGMSIANSAGLHTWDGPTTIAVWVKPDGTPSEWDGIYSNSVSGSPGAGTSFGFGASGVLRIASDSGGPNVNSTTAVTASQWNHVVASYDGTTVTFYINGEEAGGGGAYDQDATGVTDFSIGQYYGGSINTAYKYSGGICALLHYAATLTHAQIKDIYNSQRSRFGL